MKRLLLVSYGFPPVSRVQSQGAAKLAKGLASRGWKVDVLTVDDPPTYLLDEALAEEMPPSVDVHRTYSLEPTRALQALRRIRPPRPSGQPAASGPRSYTSLPQWAVRGVRALFFPEEKAGWAPWAVQEALGLHDSTPFDWIISTGPPYVSHVIARRVSRRTGVPWLAILMDPIVGCYAFPPATRAHAWLFERLERQVAEDAAAVAIATRPWAEALVGRNPGASDKVIVYPNGFDPADYDGPPPPPHEGFLVSCVGSFQLSIRPDTFLDAIVEVLRDPAIARDLHVRFVTPIDPQTTEAIERRGLVPMIERTGLVSHHSAVQHMRGSDALLFVLGPEPESSGILTGKLPEYLASGAMILAEAPEGVATDAIRRAGAGFVVPPGDTAGMIAALREMHRLWAAGAAMRPDPLVVAGFDRERALDPLCGLLSGASPIEGGRHETR